MKKTLFRKILIDCLLFFLITLISLSLIIWVFQSVNYLDIIIEDGRDYIIYLNYSLLNFPKILVKIFPFALFFSFMFVISKYEINNELMILWNIGINKIKFINFFLISSFFLMFLQIILSSYMVPLAQDKARNILKTSDANILENFVKTKNFNDNIKGLTIYIEERNDADELFNIYLKKQTTNNDFQITYAKKGYFNKIFNDQSLVLLDGETLSFTEENLTKFSFKQTDYNLSNLESNTTTYKKTQELSTKDLVECILILYNSKSYNLIKDKNKIPNCTIENTDNIYTEIYKRIIIPLYIPVLILISLVLIIYSKENINYFKLRIFVFILGILVLVFSETSLRLIDKSLTENIKIIFIPIIIIIIFYSLYLYRFVLSLKK